MSRTLIRVALVFAALSTPLCPALAATITGGNWGGAALSPADGDVLSGVFTDVSTFTVAAGTTVYVEDGTPLEVFANNILIEGTLNGDATGFIGGKGGDFWGQPTEQDFSHIFHNVKSDLTFDVLGGDARVRDLRLRVVPNPILETLVLDCRFPAYTGRSPQEVQARSLTPLPVGTKIIVRAAANKPLERVEAFDLLSEAPDVPLAKHRSRKINVWNCGLHWASGSNRVSRQGTPQDGVSRLR